MDPGIAQKLHGVRTLVFLGGACFDFFFPFFVFLAGCLEYTCCLGGEHELDWVLCHLEKGARAISVKASNSANIGLPFTLEVAGSEILSTFSQSFRDHSSCAFGVNFRQALQIDMEWPSPRQTRHCGHLSVSFSHSTWCIFKITLSVLLQGWDPRHREWQKNSSPQRTGDSEGMTYLHCWQQQRN